MDTGILLSLIYDLIYDEQENKINENLLKLKTSLIQSKSNQPNAGKSISDSIDYLKENSTKGYYERFTRSYFKTLNEIGGIKYFGENLIYQINAIFEKEQYSLDNQIKEITELQKERVDFLKKLSETKNNLEFLNLEQHYHVDDIYEIGIIIPDQNDLHYAKQLENAIHNWNLIIKGISELSGNGTEDIKIERVYNGCIELIIEQGFAVAETIGDVIKELVSIYLIIDKVKNHLIGLKKQGVNDKQLKPIEDAQTKQLEEEISKLAKQIIEKYKEIGLDQGRENEIEAQLKNGIKYIAKSLEKGVEVEIIPPYEGTSEEILDDDTEEVKKDKVENNKIREEKKKRINVIKELGTFLKSSSNIKEGVFNLLEGGENKIDSEECGDEKQ
tara:strand:- start:2012 stop:3172 length:1161 start_codon:yes stop_codon:yes gene_type:complete